MARRKSAAKKASRKPAAKQRPKKSSGKTAGRTSSLKPRAKNSSSKKQNVNGLVDLTIVNRSPFKPSQKVLSAWVNRIAVEIQSRNGVSPLLENLQWSGAQLTIAFLDLEQARSLNKMYRGRDYATDVLSFSDEVEGSLGELAICPEVVSRQAIEHGLGFDEELGYMILHGILHLLGFDHETSKRDEKVMFSLQDSIFDSLLVQ